MHPDFRIQSWRNGSSLVRPKLPQARAEDEDEEAADVLGLAPDQFARAGNPNFPSWSGFWVIPFPESASFSDDTSPGFLDVCQVWRACPGAGAALPGEEAKQEAAVGEEGPWPAFRLLGLDTSGYMVCLSLQTWTYGTYSGL